MKRDPAAFIFYESDSDFNGQIAFTAVIPSKISNKKELLEALGNALKLQNTSATTGMPYSNVSETYLGSRTVAC
jgi:hypothetical protein